MKHTEIEIDKGLQSEVGRLMAPEENETQRVLREALERLGPNGENWIKGFKTNTERFCTHTALCGSRMPDDNTMRARRYIMHVLGAHEAGHIWLWNDAPERTFSDVSRAFLKAIELAA